MIPKKGMERPGHRFVDEMPTICAQKERKPIEERFRWEGSG